MINDFIPDKSYAIVTGYTNGEIVAVLGGVIFLPGNAVEIRFPKIHPFQTGQEVTFHIDNRVGIEEFDIEMRVYRSSVKAVVTAARGDAIAARAVEYEMAYSSRVVEKFQAPSFAYPPDDRPIVPLDESSLRGPIRIADAEEKNKLGVWVTKGVGRPHTTVMAFLSTESDDIFLIAHRDTLKARNVARDADCVFAIDHRATFNFERAIDWNYTIIKGRATQISRANPLFPVIQAEFVRKNPWELPFFTDEKVIMYHIAAQSLLCPDGYRKATPS